LTNIKRIAVFANEKEVDHLIPENVIRVYSNARYWDGKYRENCDSVYAPNHPKIEDVYKESGRVVFRPSEGKTSEKAEDKPKKEDEKEAPKDEVYEIQSDGVAFKETEDESSEDSPSEASSDETPWRDLSWPKMRSLATNYTDEPIKSKQSAQDVLEKAESEGKT